MVRISFKIRKVIDGPDLDYRKNIIGLLKIPFNPGVGASVAEMRVVIPLAEKIELAKEYIDLTDDEHQIIMDRFNNARFNPISQEIVDMVDYLEIGDDITPEEGANADTQ